MFDMFQLPFMVQAFVAAAITGLLLSYMGVHVVGRGIVFVDLALGQISSLGVAFAAFIGTGVTSIPLIFTLVGALLMSFISISDKRLKQEAIIGILYAFASALTVLLISKTPHGDSDIQEVLFGNILSTSWEQIKLIGIVFGGIALLQLVFFRKFFSLIAKTKRSVGRFSSLPFEHASLVKNENTRSHTKTAADPHVIRISEAADSSAKLSEPSI